MVEIQNLSFTYPDAGRTSLTGVSLRVEEGEFVVLCGSTGSGKTTLLHHLKPELCPAGTRTGHILYRGQPLESIKDASVRAEIGLVFQDPEQQFVMETVRQELAFGLENMGLPRQEIRKRIGELTSFFGLEEWLDRDVHRLSGGQKQWVNLASVLLLRPRLLLLDEPTSQLDPVAARQFVQLLQRLGEEFSMTVIISEHHLADLYPLSTRVVMVEDGQIVAQGEPRTFCRELWESGAESRIRYIPDISKVYLTQTGAGAMGAASVERQEEPLPLTVNEGRRWAARDEVRRRFQRYVADAAAVHGMSTMSAPSALSAGSAVSAMPGTSERTDRTDGTAPSGMPAAVSAAPDTQPGRSEPYFTLRHISFRYERRDRLILDRISYEVPAHGMLAILGGNGSGKSTLLRIMLGLLQPQQGEVRFRDRPLSKLREPERYRRVGYLDQNPMLAFTHDTVAKSLQERLHRLGLQMSDGVVRHMIDALHWDEDWLPRHPYDLSGGERQKTALLFTLLSDPDVLLLDEPTKGLDPDARHFLGQFLQTWSEHKAVVLVSHDLEFAAEYASRFSMLFDGQLTESVPAAAFFSGNFYYTTSMHRVFGELVPGAVAYRDVMRVCQPGASG